jgi:cytochrome c-type biogenesis protein CcmH/NrfG
MPRLQAANQVQALADLEMMLDRLPADAEILPET